MTRNIGYPQHIIDQYPETTDEILGHREAEGNYSAVLMEQMKNMQSKKVQKVVASIEQPKDYWMDKKYTQDDWDTLSR